MAGGAWQASFVRETSRGDGLGVVVAAVEVVTREGANRRGTEAQKRTTG